MEVLGLWRHAVKSLQGERIEEAEFGAQGIVGLNCSARSRPMTVSCR